MLPIAAVLPQLRSALAEGTRAVLSAPPGAGKTTAVPPALLDAPWLEGRRIVMLEPRRLAARAAAERMAALAREPVGQTYGYRVRLQARVSERTRVEVVTEGLFTRRLLEDPGLDDVGAVIFDEFHERSLDADLGLALALQTQALLRPDLRLLVMSATLDSQGVAGLLGDAPVIVSEGRAHPVRTVHLGRPDPRALEAAVVSAVRRALSEQAGSVLVFLPGQAEIARSVEALAQVLTDGAVMVMPLLGTLDAAAQDAAIAPAPAGRRKVVLATSVAQTSLTIEGIGAVVDSGLARVPRFEPATGLTRLVTVRVSRASADQRRGRAGRLGPGLCYRLWDEAEDRGLVPFDTPEILNADLSALALDLARWGVSDPAELALLDRPSAGAWAEARSLLTSLGALDDQGRLTPHGQAMARLPLPPRLAHMLVRASDQGQADTAAAIAAILTERGLGGSGTDLAERLSRFQRESSARARDARRLIQGWTRGLSGGEPADPGALVALAYPDRIARARGRSGDYLMASGRGARLDLAEPLARETWLAVAELGGAQGASETIRVAAPVDPDGLTDLMTEETRLVREPSGRRVVRHIRRLGAIVVEDRLGGPASRADITAALVDEVEADGLKALRWGQRSGALRARLAFMAGLEDGWPDVSDTGLMAARRSWLWPLLDTVEGLDQVGDGALEAGLKTLIPWERQQRLDRLAPPRLTTPLGSAAIDYAAEGGPRVDIRVQELFGVTTHPTVGEGRTPLVLALLSPARRPIQLTRDLPGFWQGSWKEVRAEMRGRYPKHPWPENPAEAPPTTRAKPRGT